MKQGDYVYTLRFCTVKIESAFSSKEESSKEEITIRVGVRIPTSK